MSPRRVPIHGRRGVIAHAIVDADDYAAASAHRWNSDTHGYPRTSIDGEKVKLHVLLMGRKPGMVIDHVNGDPLDNRRENLRHCTQRQNLWNRMGKGGAAIRGVFKSGSRWQARIGVGSRYRSLGTFATREEAWRARQLAEIERGPSFVRGGAA